MATSTTVHLVFLFAHLLLETYAHAANCSSYSFTKNRIYALCSDLTHLNASLHWTYNASNASLTLAFVAPPAKSDGWIAWAINPKAKRMIGARALIALHGSDGLMTVNKYNITDYAPTSWSPIDLEVWSTEGEFSSGIMRLFATVALPENKTEVNHVWWVGSAVNGKLPEKHAFLSENLNATGTLNFLSGGGNGTAGGGGGNGTSGGAGGSSTVPSLSSHSLSFSPSMFAFFFFFFFFAFTYSL